MKGVIVAAGYGTRFLPVTKTIPKEMLPLYDKPLIDFILDEFEEAGIKDVIVITSRRKKVLEDYFDREVELEDYFTKNSKTKLIDLIKPRNLNFYFVRQKEMKGTGDALLSVKSLISEDAFLVAYPDDIVISKPSLSKKMIELFRKTNKTILAVREEKENISRYGVIKPELKDGFMFVKEIVEKPSSEKAPSNLVSFGRYIFSKSLFELLEEQLKNHKEGEFYHIGAINKLAEKGEVLGCEIDGMVLDTGELNSYTYSLLAYLFSHSEGKEVLKKFLKNFSAF
ncbi:MAG: UTP--glucose-1-phosphate uridylyltransferase [Brevinematia bacterium]